MDNQFTRKEVECPLSSDKFCDRNDKDCTICIRDEEQWQEEQCKRECEIQKLFDS